MSNTIVETQYGQVQGYEQGSISVWKGVPFAQPPVGKRRFRAPEPLQAWTGLRAATQFALAAAQPVSTGLGELMDAQSIQTSEDCLYLNIWSPQADTEKRPVLIWIHGGAFVSGSASTYDGTSFAAKHGLVVVGIQYRLGILGSFYPGEHARKEYGFTANCGLLDQVAALQWVHNNIAAFGGDPTNVTIVGESAGAMSVGTLLGMPAARGLFQRAILESGASSHVTLTAEQGWEFSQSLLQKLNYTDAQISDLQDLPVEALINLQNKIGQEAGLSSPGRMPYAPVIDGVTLPIDPLQQVAQGLSANVAILLGTNRDEWKLFTLMGGRPPEVNESELKRLFGARAQQVLDLYTSLQPDQAPATAWVDIMGDKMFRIPALYLAEEQLRQGAPVWMYRFDWASPAFAGAMGAAHGLEIPFVWNGLDQPFARFFLGDAPAPQHLADIMHASWAAFVRNGDPQISELPAWPCYDFTRRPTMLFDADQQMVIDDPKGGVRPFWDHL